MHQVLALPDGEEIPYLLERRARRTIGMKITVDGLVVHAPLRIRQADLEALLRSKARWITSKLKARQAATIPEFEWRDGAELRLLGQPLTLSIAQSPRNRSPRLEGNTLRLATTDIHDQAVIARKVIQWFQKEAKLDFARRLPILSARLGEPTPSLFLSNAKTRWGSCNSRREVRLNWRLIQAQPALVNYVIAHELAHLREMNHSARFWAVVASIYPDYRTAEQALKACSQQLYQIG
ncbi:M48 family metallopeptidase [Methylobacillus arboreus]|uniref:M48 family metallopeptidase n=1 Tax=Methylobacillus arboreus TaxID=755170 RepID=UPI001E5CFB34|nr:SprT family zinc-dependent metalloprotease [Methylobacillus arboreus]MCB5191427.1 M48 family metallopeptidase [Methylobacillus arboreus]